MSAQCTVAAALLDGNVTFARLQRADVAEMRILMSKVRVIADVDLSDKSAIVRAELDSGECVESRSPDMDAALRWTHGDVIANAQRLLPETTLDGPALQRLADGVAALPTAATLEELLAVLP